jgi:hypothetical protein
MRNRSTVFTLGNRYATIENEIQSSIIIPHASQKSDQKVIHIKCLDGINF